MSIALNEIRTQYTALRKTYDYITSKKEEIIKFYEDNLPKSMTFIGCGSGFSLCQSAQFSANVRLGKPSIALASGDLMLNYKSYAKFLEGTMIVAPSRSGSTSEVIKAIDNIRTIMKVPVLGISCVENSSLSKISDFVIELPWVFDDSVCQTRTVTNLYAANLLVIAFISGDSKLVTDIDTAITIGNDYMEKYETKIREAVNCKWSNVVVLADGEIQGIADEASIAFKEISQIQSNYYHLLDSRHGPMVVINKDTLVIAALTANGYDYQKDLINDILKRGAKVITYMDKTDKNIEGLSLQVTSGVELDVAAQGIPFIFISQIASVCKSEEKGLNPDNPDGLTAWIKL